jgi:8-oxo-dGTP pyrophosphatase MutT (NUDIX family)
LREFEEETGIKPDFVELEPNFKAEDSYFFTLDGKKIKKYVTYFLGELKP